jgi:hypothetical protein
VHHETDHEEGAEGELAERERGADGQSLAEIVQTDADCDERGERKAADRAASRTRACGSPREERER